MDYDNRVILQASAFKTSLAWLLFMAPMVAFMIVMLHEAPWPVLVAIPAMVLLCAPLNGLYFSRVMRAAVSPEGIHSLGRRKRTVRWEDIKQLKATIPPICTTVICRTDAGGTTSFGVVRPFLLRKRGKTQQQLAALLDRLPETLPRAAADFLKLYWPKTQQTT